MKSKLKKLTIILLAFIFILLLLYSSFLISKSRTFQFFGDIISSVETNEKVIALTFDDAPGQYTPEVLEILQNNDIKATFYLIGQSIEDNPEQTTQIALAGHELGNHSFSHHRFLLKSQNFIKYEIEKTNQLIREAGYTGEITFRPPNGKKLFGLPWYLAHNNIKTITWNIEPDTYYSGNVNMITQNILKNIKPGSIILIHPFCEKHCAADRQALPEIIQGLKNEGYRFVTISELLKSI